MKPNQIVLLAGLCLATFTFTSCDKEDVLPNTTEVPSTDSPSTPTPGSPTTPPPVTANSLLKQLGVKNYKYDSQNRLIELSYANQNYLGYTIVYEGDKPVRMNFKNGGYLLYTYQGDKVAEAVQYYGEGLVNYRHAFEYSGDKLVKKTTLSYAQSNEGRLYITEYVYDANGNLTDLIQAWSTSNRAEDLGQPITIKWGNYDNKPNPDLFANSDLYLPGVKLFQNNPGFKNDEIYSYIYHDSGMPKIRYTKLQAYPHMQSVADHYAY